MSKEFGYVSITAASKMLGVSRQSIHNWINSGKFYTVKIGDWPYIPVELIERELERRGKPKEFVYK